MKLRRDAKDTSVRAAILAQPKAGTQRAKVLALIARSKDGLTDHQIQQRLLLPESSERPRRVELVEQGWVEDSGRRRLVLGHSEAIVWQLTEQARQEVA